LTDDSKSFKDYEKTYQKLLSDSMEAPDAYFALYEQGKVHGDTIEKLVNNLQGLQKNVEEYLESRRLAFPRFFFLNDA
jgi:dynein heavy chain